MQKRETIISLKCLKEGVSEGLHGEGVKKSLCVVGGWGGVGITVLQSSAK